MLCFTTAAARTLLLVFEQTIPYSASIFLDWLFG
jgi:hypothetical protein